MEYEQIILCLKKIRFDYQRHNSIKEALKEIVDNDKYSTIMRGIVTNKDDETELKSIIESYKQLSRLTQDELKDAILKFKRINENINDDDIDGSIESIIIDIDNKLYLKHKNVETGEYEDILELSSSKMLGDFIFENGLAIYNLLGEKIWQLDLEKEDVYSYRFHGNILKLYGLRKNNVTFIKSNGLRLSSSSYSEEIYEKIINIFLKLCDKYCEQFFNVLINGNIPKYLEYEIVDIKQNYLYCKKNGEICFFNIEGEKIISTDDGIYSFIGSVDNKFEGDNLIYNFQNNIVVVASYDNNFNKVYGYYDLDKRDLVTKLNYKKANPFTDYCTLAIKYDDTCDLITRDELGKIRISDASKTIGEASNSLIPVEVCKCNDNLFLIKLYKGDNENGFARYYHLLIKDFLTKPRLLFDFGVCSEFDSPKYIENLDIFIYKRFNDYYCVDKNGNQCLLTVDSLLNFKPCIESDKPKILPLISNSEFLLPSYKNSENALLCANGKGTEIERKKLFELSNSIYTSSNLFANSNNCNLKNGKVMYIHKESKLLLIGSITNGQKIYKDCIFNLMDGICFKNDNFEDIEIDYLNNIRVSLKYGDGKKQYLLDRQGNVLIGPVDKINYPECDIYIVTNKGVMQCYQNGVPISYSADEIKWVTKKIISRNGNMISKKEILVFKNGENLYLLDDDGLKIIKQDQTTLEIKKLLLKLDI